MKTHKRLARGFFVTLEETLEEIRDDYFAGRLTAEQRLRYEVEAFHGQGVYLEHIEELESN